MNPLMARYSSASGFRPSISLLRFRFSVTRPFHLGWLWNGSDLSSSGDALSPLPASAALGSLSPSAGALSAAGSDFWSSELDGGSLGLSASRTTSRGSSFLASGFAASDEGAAGLASEEGGAV